MVLGVEETVHRCLCSTFSIMFYPGIRKVCRTQLPLFQAEPSRVLLGGWGVLHC